MTAHGRAEGWGAEEGGLFAAVGGAGGAVDDVIFGGASCCWKCGC